jgi:hypothetical protein
MQSKNAKSLIWKGGVAEVTAHNGRPFTDGASATGTIEVDGLRLITNAAANTADFQGWSTTGSTTFLMRMLRGWSSSAPASTACNFGDIFRNSAPAAGNPGDWTCTTVSTTSGTFTNN